MSDPSPAEHPHPSGLPYPAVPPETREELPDRGLPGAPASWGLRGAARIIDTVIFSFVFGFVTNALGTKIDPETGDLSGPLWPLLLFPICFMLYETVLLARYGQTLGKWVCQVKAVSWYSGDLADPRQTFVRAVVPGVFALVAAAAPIIGLDVLGYLQFVPVLIYLSSIANILYRGPHDKAGGTIVLAAPRSRGT